MATLILASQSPRRKEILSLLNIPFKVEIANTKEVVNTQLDIFQIPINIALQKAMVVQKKLGLNNHIILAADTIVVIDKKILGKPSSTKNAIEMLQLLSNKMHQVITGVVIINQVNNQIIQFSETTNVYFNKLKKNQINDYVNKGNPFDKAGSYAIQEWIGLVGINKIEGDYYNVMGLPIQKIYPYLLKFKIK